MKVAQENRVEISREEIHDLLLKENEVSLVGNDAEEGETIVMATKTDDKDKNGVHEPLQLANGNAGKKGQETEKQASPSVLDIFKHPNLRRGALNIFFNW